jgi:predicted nucleotidyltransferase
MLDLRVCGHRYHAGMDRATEEDLQRFHDALRARFGDDLITLAAFGSQVLGTARPESDLDLLLIARGLRSAASWRSTASW